MKKSSGRKNHTIGRNTKEQHQRMGSNKGTQQEIQTVIEREQNCLCQRKNICSKQQENSRADSTRKLQPCRYWCQSCKKGTQFFSHFLPIFYFLFLFLAPRIRVSSSIGHMAQRRFQKDDVILCADLMANTWSFRVGQKQLAQTMMIQYIKVDYSVQSFPLSSLM